MSYKYMDLRLCYEYSEEEFLLMFAFVIVLNITQVSPIIFPLIWFYSGMYFL